MTGSNNNNNSTEPQSFCLRRSGHTDDLIRDFAQMLEDEELTDVTLSCEDGSMNVHRMFLSANSTYFKTLFAKLSSSGNKTQYPVIILRDILFPDLKAIMDFVYRGEVIVPQNQLAAVLRAADSLKIRGLNGSDVPNDISGSGKKKKRKKRKRRKSKGSSDDGEDGTGGASGDANNGSNAGTDNEEGSGNDLMSDEDDEDEEECYPRTHITPVSDDRNSVSTVGDLEPSRLLEQSMTITGVHHGSSQGTGNSSHHTNHHHSHGGNNNSSSNNRYTSPGCASSSNSSVVANDPSGLISQIESLSESLSHHHHATSGVTGLLGFDPHVASIPGSSVSSLHRQSQGEVRSFGAPSVSGSGIRQVVNCLPLESLHPHHPLHPHHSLSGHNHSNSHSSSHSNSVTNDLIRRSRYQCPVCLKAFSEKGNMKRHMSIHAHQRQRYMCDLCSKGFSWKDNFNRHRRTHHV